MILYVFVYIILILIFNSGFSMSMCTLKVMQPQELLHARFNQSISISCHVNMSCQNKMLVQWYVFGTDSYYEVKISNHPMKYRLQGTDLHISSFSDSDEGVYYCAASYQDLANSGAQDIGTGTTLTVKDNYNVGKVVLLTLVVFLSLYILIILTLFICVKTGRVTLLKGRQSQRQGKGESTRNVHFGAVVQELYSKRNLRRNKKNTSTEVTKKNKVEKSRPPTGKEDIYQNLKIP
ncbi:uncharacterized protein si:ch211-139g16.8 [Tachysurus fulvidraco]|uniref:uncharacterized protein si:ch211-139g16.8 n=1 Tax=Tachysurus fulvidraco TaxID=1234273 RepID=UPI001FEE33D1|nr:uncharacterized protein si:ch211-139g16.8 [Tachysurus fulvidraco]